MRDFDVLIAGAGAAGLVAALAAAHRGARVALLEREAAEPSNLAISGGLFAAAGTRWQRNAGVEDSPALFAADVQAKTSKLAEPVVLQAVARHAARAAEFMADVAQLPIHLHTTSAWSGHSVPRLHAVPAESGAELQELLRAAVARVPRIALHDGAELLRARKGGAEFSVSGSRRFMTVRAVVLATGGFGASSSLLTRFCPGPAVHVGSALSDGSALRATEGLNVALACMTAYQGQPHVSPYLVQGERPRFGASLPALGAVLVNRLGNRFAAEDMGPSELTAHILAQPGGRAVELWDETAHHAALRGGPFRRAVELGAVRMHENIPGVASSFDLPLENLATTLGAAARTACGEVPDMFGRRHWRALLGPPFFAAEIVGGLAHTQGGLRVDRSARVLHRDGTAISWLFAAGGAACGISGDGAAGYLPGNGLAQSFALGLLAGEGAVP